MEQIHDMPNLFMLYGAQSPCAFTNGPVFLSQQVEWVIKMIETSKEAGIRSVEPTEEAVEKWREQILQTSEATLFGCKLLDLVST